VSANHARIGRIVMVGLWLDAGIVMSASAVNGGRAFVALGEPFAAGLALGVAVDVALAVALWGDRALHLAGESSPWGRVLRVTTALMSGALNCSVAVWSGHYGVAVFHAFLPLLLILLTEYAQSSTLKFGTIADRQRAAGEAARTEAELAQRQERQEHNRRERELVISLASVLAIGARLTSTDRPTGITTSPQSLTTSPRRNRAVTSSPARGESGGEDMAAAVVWAVSELTAGRTAGWRVIAKEHGLSEHRAKKAADAAKDQHGTPGLHAVERSA